MKTKYVQWRLRSGLLYAGLRPDNYTAILTDADNAEVFDSRDNPEIKKAFYGAMLGVALQVELVS